MRDRINGWLRAEPIPRDLRARVMTDRRLAVAGGGGVLRGRLAMATAAMVVLVLGAGLASVLLRGTPPRGQAGVVTTPTASPTPDATPSPIDTPPAVTPSPSPTAPGVPACRTLDLSVTIGHSQGAAGTIYVPFEVANRVDHPCTLSGYFGMALLDASGKQLGPDPARDPAPTPAAGPVTLAPLAVAMFTFHWSQVQASSTPCAQASRVELTAPNQTDHTSVPARTADGINIAPCYPGGSGLSVVQPKA